MGRGGVLWIQPQLEAQPEFMHRSHTVHMLPTTTLTLALNTQLLLFSNSILANKNGILVDETQILLFNSQIPLFRGSQNLNLAPH